MMLTKSKNEIAEEILGLFNESLIPLPDTPSPSSSARFREGEYNNRAQGFIVNILELVLNSTT